MKHTIRLSDTSHVSYPVTSNLTPSVIEIILLPPSPSSITLGGRYVGGGERGVMGIFQKKKREKSRCSLRTVFMMGMQYPW